MEKRRKAARAGAALGVTVALAATSCGRPGPRKSAGTTTTTVPFAAPPTSSTSPASTAPSTTVDATKAAILAAYRAAEAAFEGAAGHILPDPSDPLLPATMTDPELSAVQNRLTLAKFQRQYAVGTTELAPVVASVAGDTAVISDCIFDHSRILDTRTGQTVSGPDTVRMLQKVTMHLVGGTWKKSGDQTVGSGCLPGV